MNFFIKISTYCLLLFFSSNVFANSSLINFTDFQKFKFSIKSNIFDEIDSISEQSIENDFIRASRNQIDIIKDTLSSASCNQNDVINTHRELSDLFTELSFDIYNESKNYLIKCNVLTSGQDSQLRRISLNSIKQFYNLPTIATTFPAEYTFEKSYEEVAVKTTSRSMLAIGALAALGISQAGGGGGSSCLGSCPIITMSVNKTEIYDSDTLGVSVTATASEISSVPVTINLLSSGTATYGTDYNGPSAVIIPAGNLQASVNYVPVADNNYEGTETIIVEISSVINGREQGTQSASINLKEYAIEYQTVFTEDANYNATVKGWEEYDNVHGFFQGSSSMHPYDQINAHRALSFKSGSTYLTGAGEYIAIMDSNCDTDHNAFDQKKAAGLVKSYGTFTADSASAHHCNAVAGFAAGEYDNTTDPDTIMGVAFEAGLHFADWKSSTAINELYWADYQANAINDASNYNAIAHNNSWGHPTNVSEMNVQIANNPGFTTKQILTTVLNGGAGSQNVSTDANAVASFDRYVAALNNFQDHGIIVFSLGNDTAESDAGWNAGLPEWEPTLGEAWLSVGVFQNTGSTLAQGTITRKGNPCGTTAPYCVFLDGWRIGYAQHFDGGVSNYTDGSCCFGSSWTAPIVSGGIAILAQAFPNHTPEQLTDRILATANNTYFTHTGNVEFVNGIRHGYNTEFGHGTPDLYKAMSPVLTSMTTLMTPVGNTIYRNGGSGSGFSPKSTYIVLTNSFGNTISNQLSNKNFYFYDALNGGFKVPFSDQILKNNSDLTDIKVLVFQNIYKLRNVLEVNESRPFTNILFNKDNANRKHSLFSINIDSPSIPIQYFNRLNKGKNLSLTNHKNPFLDFQKGGLGISSQFNHNGKKIKIGFHDSSLRTGIFGDTNKNTKTLAVTSDYKINDHEKIAFLSGLMIEKNTLMDLEGSGALNFNNTNPHSFFSGLNFEKQISSKLSISFNSILSYSSVNNPDNSLVKKFTPLISSSYGLSISNKRIFSDDDSLTVQINQPHRIESGNMALNIPSLADKYGNIAYELQSISLEPSGRQIDIGLDYTNKYDKNLTFGLSTNFSRDLGHVSQSSIEKAVTITGLLTF